MRSEHLKEWIAKVCKEEAVAAKLVDGADTEIGGPRGERDGGGGGTRIPRTI